MPRARQFHAPNPPKNLADILAALVIAVPDPTCELVYHTPFELLIATQLSAQSTDAMVNKVTPELFRRWPDAPALAAADPAEVEAVLRPTGFFRQKTKHAIRTAEVLVERFGGQVPDRLEDLVTLPGVARKTANVVLGTAFGIQSGVTVDTHVLRVTARWGLAHRDGSREGRGAAHGLVAEGRLVGLRTPHRAVRAIPLRGAEAEVLDLRARGGMSEGRRGDERIAAACRSRCGERQGPWAGREA